MQVPERLALIGGGILLSSTLVFTLKSQASTIIPNVSHSISGVFNHIGDAQKASDFDNGYQQAQKNGWKTGAWGNTKYYIDNQHNMYVGKGELQTGATLRNTLGDNETDALKTLTITQPVKAPQDSKNLFSTSNGDTINNSSLEQINGLENVDTSQVTTMFNMFTNDTALTSINGIKDWDVTNVSDMGWMFYNTSSLKSLDVSGWNDAKLPNPALSVGSGFCKMLGNTGIENLSLGANTKVDAVNLPAGNYKSGDNISSGWNLQNTSSPGTWIRQK